MEIFQNFIISVNKNGSEILKFQKAGRTNSLSEE